MTDVKALVNGGACGDIDKRDGQIAGRSEVMVARCKVVLKVYDHRPSRGQPESQDGVLNRNLWPIRPELVEKKIVVQSVFASTRSRL